MAKSVKKETSVFSPPIRLTMIAPAGPNLAYHVACAINNTIYLHGGIDKKGSIQPLGKLYAMDLSIDIWQEVRASGSPSLSHHACVVIENRYMVLIGGWNGKVRSGDIFSFDTKEQRWEKHVTSGFHPGAGLSSHTATLLSSGDILVIGREGSARTQGRHGNGWLLQGTLSSGNFHYKEIIFDFDSRSGHSSHAVRSKIVTLGGRADELMQVIHDFKPVPTNCSFMGKLSNITECHQPMKRAPCGRKNHVGLSGNGVIIVHGGNTFDGKNREPVGEIYLLSLKSTPTWYKLMNTTVGRSGHSLAHTDTEIYFHGGEGGKNTIHADLYRIDMDS